jgi:hypothetical protein
MCLKASAQRIIESRRKRGRVPGAFSARSATLLGAVAPVSKPKLMSRLSQFSAAEQITLINQT